ncbi:MAG TPA: hypothetical protein VFS39_10325 [Nitrospira sp.]|nr:hypothetical protein [Nitrospira sp.]
MALMRFGDGRKAPTFHWSAVAAGLFVALGIHIVLTSFGLGIAFLGAETSEGGNMALGLLIWSGAAWIVGSFLGGYITAWVADASRYIEGLFHGLVLWGTLTFVIMFLPPSTMGLGTMGADTFLSTAVISSVSWFVAIGGLLSLGTTIWGALVGSRVVERVETKAAEAARAA